MHSGGAFRRRQHHGRAAKKYPTTVGELSRTHLRTRQVGQHRHHLPSSFGGLANGLQTEQMRRKCPVAQVQAHDVDTGQDQFIEYLRRLAGRAQCGNDLRSGIGARGHQLLT